MPPYAPMGGSSSRRRLSTPPNGSNPPVDERTRKRAQMRSVLSAARANGFGSESNSTTHRSASRKSHGYRTVHSSSSKRHGLVPGAALASANASRQRPAHATTMSSQAPSPSPSPPRSKSNPNLPPPAALKIGRSLGKSGFYAPSKRSQPESDHPGSSSSHPTPKRPRTRSPVPQTQHTASSTSFLTTPDAEDQAENDEDEEIGLGQLVRGPPRKARPTPPQMPDSDITLHATPSSKHPTSDSRASSQTPLPRDDRSALDSDSDEGMGLGVLARRNALQPLPAQPPAPLTKPAPPKRKMLTTTRSSHSTAQPPSRALDARPQASSSDSTQVPLAPTQSTQRRPAPPERRSPRRVPSGDIAAPPPPPPQQMVVEDSEISESEEELDSDLDEMDDEMDPDDDQVMLLGPGRSSQVRPSRVTRVLNPASTLPAKRLERTLANLFEEEDSVPVPSELGTHSQEGKNWSSEWLEHVPGTRARVVLRASAVAHLTKWIKAAAWPFAQRAASDVRDLATLESLFPVPRQLSDLDAQIIARLVRILTRTTAADDDDPEPGAPQILSSKQDESSESHYEQDRNAVTTYANRCVTACSAAECLATLLSAPGVPASLLREDALSSALEAVKCSISGILSPLADAATLTTPPTAPTARFFATLARDLDPTTITGEGHHEAQHWSAVQCATTLQSLLSATRAALRALATLLDGSGLPPSEQVGIAASDVALTGFFLPAADDDRTTPTQQQSSTKFYNRKKKSQRTPRKADDVPSGSPSDLWNAIADPEALSRRSKHEGTSGSTGGPLTPAAQAVLRTVFKRVPSQRIWIVDELVTALLRNSLRVPSGKEDGMQLRAPHALLLHLIQAAARAPAEVGTLIDDQDEHEELDQAEVGKPDESSQAMDGVQLVDLPSQTTEQPTEQEHTDEQPDTQPGFPNPMGSGPLSGARGVVNVVVRMLIGRLSSLSASEDARGSETLLSLVSDISQVLGSPTWPGASILLERLGSALLALLHLPLARATSPGGGGGATDVGQGSNGAKVHPSTRTAAIDVLARILGSVSSVASRLGNLPTPRAAWPATVQLGLTAGLTAAQTNQAGASQPDHDKPDEKPSEAIVPAKTIDVEPETDEPNIKLDEVTHDPDQPLTLHSSIQAIEGTVQQYVHLIDLLADSPLASTVKDEARRFWFAQAWAEMDTLQRSAQAVIEPAPMAVEDTLELGPPRTTPSQLAHAREVLHATQEAQRILAQTWNPCTRVPQRDRTDHNVALSKACMSLALAVVRRIPLGTIQAVLVDCLDDRVVGNRTRALRALASTTDTLWSDPTLVDTVLARLSDTSPSVRDAALQLVGTHVLAQLRSPPKRVHTSSTEEDGTSSLSTLQTYAPVLFSRASDASLSVRKRALRLCAAAYSGLGAPDENELELGAIPPVEDNSRMELDHDPGTPKSLAQQRDDLRVQLALTLVRSVGDDDPAVQQLALDELQEVWFGLGSTSTTASSPNKQGVKLEVKAEAKATAERLVQHARIVTSVSGNIQERPSPLEEVFRRVGRPSTPAGVGFGVRDPSTAEALERACRALVDHLLAALVGIEPAAGQFADWMATVHTVVIAHPASLSVSRTKALLPHLRAAQGAAELRVAELIIRILRARLPSLPRTARLFAEKLQGTLAGAINRIPPGVAPLAPLLQELVAAFSAAINTLTHDFGLLVRMTAAAWGRFNDSIVSTGESTDFVPAPPSRAAALATSLTALLVEYTDFDALRDEDPEVIRPLDAIVAPGKPIRATLVTQLLDLLHVPTWRPLVLRALGFLLRRHAMLWTRPDVADAIASALAPQSLDTHGPQEPGDVSVLAALAVTGDPDQRSRHLILTTMTEFLALDDERLEQATSQREREAVKIARTGGRSARMELLAGETEAMADSTVSTQVIQQYLDPVLACAVNPAAPAVQTLALEVVRHTVMRGLAHPLQCLPALIGLQTSSEARLASRATTLHTHLSDRHASLLHVRWPDHIKAAFEYHLAEHCVLHASNEIEPMLRGYQILNGVPRALLASWYSLVVPKRTARVEFLRALVRMVDVDVSSPVSEDRLSLSRFAADNLATLPYRSQDEVIQVVHELIVMLTVSGMQTLAVAAAYGQRIERETCAVLSQAPASTRATVRSTTDLSSPAPFSSPGRSSPHLESSPARNNSKSSPSFVSPKRRNLRERKDVFYGTSSEDDDDGSSELTGSDLDEDGETMASPTKSASSAHDEGLESSEPHSDQDAGSDWSDTDQAQPVQQKRTKRTSTTIAASRKARHTLGMGGGTGAEILALDMDLDPEGPDEPHHSRAGMADHARAAMAMSIALGLRMHLRWLYRVTDVQLTRYAELLAAGTRRKGRVIEASNRQAHLRVLEDPTHTALDLDTPLAAVQAAVDLAQQSKSKAMIMVQDEESTSLPSTPEQQQDARDLHVLRLFQELVATDGPLDTEANDESDMDDD